MFQMLSLSKSAVKERQIGPQYLCLLWLCSHCAILLFEAERLSTTLFESGRATSIHNAKTIQQLRLQVECLSEHDA